MLPPAQPTTEPQKVGTDDPRSAWVGEFDNAVGELTRLKTRSVKEFAHSQFPAEDLMAVAEFIRHVSGRENDKSEGHDGERLHELGHKNLALTSENEELKAEVTELRRQLNVYQSPVRCDFVEDDGGRDAAKYGGASGDCVARAIAIATCKPYAEVFEALKARHNSYVKRLPHDHYERRTRSEPIHNGCSEKVSGLYLKSLGWKYTRIKERTYLRAGALASGRLIVSLRGHYVALIDDTIHDTYDSGSTC